MADKPTRVWVLLCSSFRRLGRVLCAYHLGGKRDLVDVLKLRLMRWEVSLDYLGGLGELKRVLKVFIYLFILAVLGFCCCMSFSLVVASRATL